MAEVKEWKLIFEKEAPSGVPIKECVGVIEFFIEKDDVWLNTIEVVDDLKRMNVATFLVKEGIKEFGALLISSATKSEHKRHGDPNDSRYLEPDGNILVGKLLSSGVIKNEWLRNPFKSTGNTI